jgi:hypothetical protein
MNIFLSILLSLLGRALGAFVAISFGRFLGSEGTAIMTKGTNLLLFAILILGLIFLFRFICLRLNLKSRFLLVFIYLSICFFISLFGYFLRIYLLSHFGLHLNEAFSFIVVCGMVSGTGQALPLPSPSGGSDDAFAIDVLLESWSKTTETEEGTSVNKPEAGLVPPANPVASPGEEAGPPNQSPRVVSYPYQPDEVIGGDSVNSIEGRLLAKYSFPSSEVIQMARIQAEDLFEVKVEIIRLMAGLDPTGDWMVRGARALDNPRTATGEESLEKLYEKLEDLRRGGVRSSTFWELKGRIFLRQMDPPQNSST